MKKIKTGVSRRAALGLVAAAAAAGLENAKAQTPASPSVRRKTKISYWTWADNPSHQQRYVDAIAAFNRSQEFITVELDASAQSQEMRKKVIVAFAAGAAPDVTGTVQTNLQDWYNADMLHPIEEFFNKWEDKGDFYPSIVAAMRGKPSQPILYLATSIVPYFLFYRADWFDEAKIAPPRTLNEFVAVSKLMTKQPDRYGYAMRGGDYFGIQVVNPIWGSAGIKFVDDKGQVDFESPAAIAITEKYVGMFTKDKSVPPTAVNDRITQLFALMERGRCAMWIYGPHGAPQLQAALGDRISAVPTPRVGDKDCMLSNPTGNFILKSSKEKEASWEFLKFMNSGAAARSLSYERGFVPVRKTLADDPAVKNNRFFKLCSDYADAWWNPPYDHPHWSNYQDKIAPYWQELLRESITAKDFHVQAAKLLRGEA